MTECPYCWDSHGCDLEEGHTGDHICANPDNHKEPCSVRTPGANGVFHWKTLEPEVVDA